MKSTDRFYPLLTPTTAAVVAWGLMPIDPEEAERVAATVPHEYRVVPVLAFSEAVVWLQAVSATWGVTHWRLMTERGAACAALALARTDSDTVGAADAVRASEGRLMACDDALDAAALEGGFDAQAVRDFAQAVRFVPMHPDAIADADFGAMLRAAFRPLGAGRGRY